MASKDDLPPLGYLLVLALAVVGGIAAVGWALGQVLKALASMTGAAVAGAAASPLIATTLTIGIGGGGTVLALTGLATAVRQAKKEPYPYAVSLLGVVNGLLLDIAKEFSIEGSALRMALVAVVAFLVVIAGACYAKGGVLWKVVAVVLILLPPLAVLVQNLRLSGAGSLQASFAAVPGAAWVRVGGFLVVGLIVALLHHLSTHSKGAVA